MHKRSMISWVCEGLGLILFFILFGTAINGVQEGNLRVVIISISLLVLLIIVGLLRWAKSR